MRLEFGDAGDAAGLGQAWNWVVAELDSLRLRTGGLTVRCATSRMGQGTIRDKEGSAKSEVSSHNPRGDLCET